MGADLGGIGKGYAVDSVIRQLRTAGVKAAMVDAGPARFMRWGSRRGKKAGWCACRNPGTVRSYGKVNWWVTWLHLSNRLHSFHRPTSRPSRYVPSSPGWPSLNHDRKGPSLTLRE